jgi:hypothetical protein
MTTRVLHTATGLDEVRAALAEAPIDHVIMGAGLDLEVRLGIVRAVSWPATPRPST